LDGGGLGALLGGRNGGALPRAGPHGYPRPIGYRILRVHGGSGALDGTGGGVRTPETSRGPAPLPRRGPRHKVSIVGDDPERDHARWLLLGRPSGRNVRAHARARRILSPSLGPIAASRAPPKPPASPPRMPRTVKAGSAPRRPSSPELLGPRGDSASGQGLRSLALTFPVLCCVILSSLVDPPVDRKPRSGPSCRGPWGSYSNGQKH
jgi:hypothetical protein